MSIVKFISINLIFVFISSISYASPTSNEFIPCNKTAVALLEQCLKDKDSNCWAVSKNGYASCRKRVFSSHRSDPQRIRAEKKRVEEIKNATGGE